jgi:hypothetical protein
MDPIVAQFFSETLPVVGAAALLWGLGGALAGAALGAGVYALLARRGWWSVDGRAAGFVRALSMLVVLSSGVIGVGAATAAVGTRISAEPALRDSHVGKDAFPAYGKLGADLIALVTWWGPEIADPTKPIPQPESAVAFLKAWRESGTELPVSQIHAAMDGLTVALRGPQGDEVANRLLQAVEKGVPPQMAAGLNQGVSEVIDAVRGKHAALPIVQLAWASQRMEEAAAESGDKAAISRDELGKLALEAVILPVALQPFGWVLAGLVAALEGVLLASNIAYLLFVALLRRILAKRTKVD